MKSKRAGRGKAQRDRTNRQHPGLKSFAIIWMKAARMATLCPSVVSVPRVSSSAHPSSHLGAELSAFGPSLLDLVPSLGCRVSVRKPRPHGIGDVSN